MVSGPSTPAMRSISAVIQSVNGPGSALAAHVGVAPVGADADPEALGREVRPARLDLGDGGDDERRADRHRQRDDDGDERQA